MNILIYILFYLFQKLSHQSDPQFYRRPFDCNEKKLSCYGNENNNQIKNYLKSLSDYQKATLLEQQIQHYALIKLQVKNTQSRGMGIFLLQDISNGMPLWRFEHKKIIGSIKINYGMFFQNTLSLAHQKQQLQLNQTHEKYTHQLLYHFSMIEKSFLKGDLSSLPFDEISPIFHLTPYEIDLLNTNFNTQIYDYIMVNQKSVKNDYKYFIQELKRQFSQEQITLVFQRDQITMQEFVLIRQYQKTRSHGKIYKSKEQSFLTPIMHYVNCYDDNYERITNFETSPSQKYIFFNILGNFKKGDEYLNYYNYRYVHVYALWSGFVPNTFSNFCFKVQLIEEKYARSFKLAEEICLKDLDLKQYILDLNENVKKQNINDTNTNNYYKALEILRAGIKNIKRQKNELHSFIQEIQDYINLRKKHLFDTKHIQTILDYIQFRYNHLDNRPEFINTLVKQFWIH